MQKENGAKDSTTEYASNENNSDEGGALGVPRGYKGQNEWILVSDCSFHVTPNRDIFSTYKKVDGGKITLGDIDTCKVIDIDSVLIKMHDGMVRTLYDVRYVPKLKKNLISLGNIGCFRL